MMDSLSQMFTIISIHHNLFNQSFIWEYLDSLYFIINSLRQKSKNQLCLLHTEQQKIPTLKEGRKQRHSQQKLHPGTAPYSLGRNTQFPHFSPRSVEWNALLMHQLLLATQGLTPASVRQSYVYQASYSVICTLTQCDPSTLELIISFSGLTHLEYFSFAKVKMKTHDLE